MVFDAADPAFRALIDDFLATLPERISPLRRAACDGDRPSAQQLAHQLKGAGGGYGYPRVSQLAAAVEQHCLQESPQEDLLRAVERLAEECQRAVAEKAGRDAVDPSTDQAVASATAGAASPS